MATPSWPVRPVIDALPGTCRESRLDIAGVVAPPRGAVDAVVVQLQVDVRDVDAGHGLDSGAHAARNRVHVDDAHRGHGLHLDRRFDRHAVAQHVHVAVVDGAHARDAAARLDRGGGELPWLFAAVEEPREGSVVL